MVPIDAVMQNGDTTIRVYKPSELPSSVDVKRYMEPISRITVITPPEYIGATHPVRLLYHEQQETDRAKREECE